MNWRKYYGQTFLIDLRIAKEIIERTEIKSFEEVCEMGSGKGILVPYLCQKAKFVKSFEVDYKLYKKIKILQSKFNNLEIINEDILKHMNRLKFDVFVSNIPYSKSKEIFLWLATNKFDRATLMVQDEFSQKIQSKTGEKNYRAVSAIAQYCFNIQPLFKVDRKSFYPKPHVDSQVIKLISKNKLLSKDTISKIHLIFSFKNKKLSKLNNKLNTNLNEINLRVKEMEPEKIIELSKLI
jgi:16S rRNA (adenine1518-N6/adenine1519-N6)-dimethyltransferase